VTGLGLDLRERETGVDFGVAVFGDWAISPDAVEFVAETPELGWLG